MKILLVKCHKRTIFSRLEPIVTEPLELEYLAGLLDRLAVPYRVYDPLLEDGSFEKVFNDYRPDVLVLSGYITAVDTIISYSQYAKNRQHRIKVIVGGVHAAVNYEDFFVDTVDFIVHSDGVSSLEQLLKCSFQGEKAADIDGIAFFHQGKWQVNSKKSTSLENMPFPNRSYFEKYQSRTKYLGYSPIAIIQTAISCPFKCNFCYCRMLNMGIYAARSIKSVVEEIEAIQGEYVWIVDDSFLLDRTRILQFIDEIEKRGIAKKFIAYSRIDFIANNPDIISKLAGIGFVELIVGMEAVDDKILEGFNKEYTFNDSVKATDILQTNNINLTALFIAGIDFTRKDFKRLKDWIRKLGISCYTVSIFTPLKGTAIYQAYESQIEVKDYSKWDFLHLTIKPVHMNALLFYFYFYLIFADQLIRSRQARSLIYQALKNIVKPRRKNNE